MICTNQPSGKGMRTSGLGEALLHEPEVGGVVEGLVPVLHPDDEDRQVKRNTG
jgi:hypothetical protein